MKTFKKFAVALTAVAAIAIGSIGASAAGASKHAEPQGWSFEGPTGTYDRASAQRGFQVFREVCSSCHSLKYFKFRNLSKLGYPAEQIKAMAAEYEVQGDPDDAGDPTMRKGSSNDAIPAPFPNENAARSANGGALPPDLSLITKARHDGSNYTYALLNGYEETPAEFSLPDGMSYNPYFKGDKIAMAQPLFEDQVEYQDGTKASVENMSRDVVNFLSFVGEPSLEQRHQMGVFVLFILFGLIILSYLSMKKIWAPIKRGEDVMPD